MNIIKISLVLIVVAVIAFFVVQALWTPPPPPPPPIPQNQFNEKIKEEIQVLTNAPDDKFTKNLYLEICNQILEFFKNGKLGKDSLENTRMQKSLTKQLYDAYVMKFISQAFYVFNNSEWKSDDLSFIQSEYKELQNSELFQGGSPIDKKFEEIKEVISKYDEIINFINTCNNPDGNTIDELNNKKAQANKYIENELDNQYVNNCIRLHLELKRVIENLDTAIVDTVFVDTFSVSDRTIDEWEIKSTINKLLSAEDNRNISDILYFYSPNIYQYWGQSNPTTTQIQNRYFASWSKTSYTKNDLKSIQKINDNTYIYTVDFTYYSIKDQMFKTVYGSRVKLVFDSYYKIVSISSI